MLWLYLKHIANTAYDILKWGENKLIFSKQNSFISLHVYLNIFLKYIKMSYFNIQFKN